MESQVVTVSLSFRQTQSEDRERACKDALSEMGKDEEEQIWRASNWAWVGVDGNQKFSFNFLILRFQDIKKEMSRNVDGMSGRSSEKTGLETWT